MFYLCLRIDPNYCGFFELQKPSQPKVGLRIADCETGNPPEGWESEGQLRIGQRA